MSALWALIHSKVAETGHQRRLSTSSRRGSPISEVQAIVGGVARRCEGLSVSCRPVCGRVPENRTEKESGFLLATIQSGTRKPPSFVVQYAVSDGCTIFVQI
jgi:hypothetical protein